MVKQYPHTLKASAVNAATQANDGNWTPSATPVAETEQKCRAESSDGNGYLTNSDGSRIDFSWIVYLPLGATEVPIDTNVKIYNGAVLMCSDNVKRFLPGQLNCRIWL